MKSHFKQAHKKRIVTFAKRRLREGASVYLENLDFPTRILNPLLGARIFTTGELWTKSKVDLLKLPGFGIKSWEFVRNFAHEHGYDHV